MSALLLAGYQAWRKLWALAEEVLTEAAVRLNRGDLEHKYDGLALEMLEERARLLENCTVHVIHRSIHLILVSIYLCMHLNRQVGSRTVKLAQGHRLL